MTSRQTLAATGTITLGQVSPTTNGEWVVQLSGTWVGTLQSKAYLPNQPTLTGQSSLAIADRQAIAYAPQKTGALTDPTTTGLTANGLYTIPAKAGEMVVLECTAYTSGTIIVDAYPSLLAH